ncbi:MAG: apolipoprotein N-acyltransferase [Ruminococcaceae bacterium]|nr:apolipoprotein N-acyltransferase [Oscillospiraceae bacterium]
MNKKHLLILFISGIVSALPYVFPSLFFISWFSFIPAIFILIKLGHTVTKRSAYLSGMVFGLGYFGVTYYWFWCLYPMEFAGVTPMQSVALMLLCWLGLSLIHALEFGALPLLYRLIAPNNTGILVRAFKFVGLFTVFEWQQSLFWRGVPWARLAITQSAFPALQQSASLFGSIFTGAIIISVNALLTTAICYALSYFKGESFKARLFSALKVRSAQILAAAALLLFTANLLFGVIRIAIHNEKQGDPLVAGVIQGNISSLEKWGVSDVDTFIADQLALTYDCVKETGASLIVWSETVIPISLSYHSEVQDRISALAMTLDVTILVGAFDSIYNDEAWDYDDYNAIYLFTPDGEVGETRYYKRQLVPFGEYMPLEKLIMSIFPILDELNLLGSTLTPGNDSNLFDTEFGKVGSLICFDSIYQQLALDSVRDGARILTVSTNDSWFSDSAALYQHNGHSVLRAIETGRYVLRSANTGVSTVISSEGAILDMLPPLEKGYASAEIYATDEHTLYSYAGDIFVYLTIGALVFLAGYDVLKGKMHK